MSKNLKPIDMSDVSCRSIRHDNDDVSAELGNYDELSPLQKDIRWEMVRFGRYIRRKYPDTDMPAARLMVIDELKRGGWVDVEF